MMYFDGHHICTSPFPTEAATFNIMAPSTGHEFRGVFQAIVDPDEPTPNNTTVAIKMNKFQPQSVNGATEGPVSKVGAFYTFLVRRVFCLVAI